MTRVEKAIVTNLTALRAKYGPRTREVTAAIGELVAADRKRGIAARLICIDDARTMDAIGAGAVRDPGDRRGAKRAIDAVDAAFEPAYILILGGPDIVPLQLLHNLIEDDEDRMVPSDLPYACEAPFSTDVRDFLGPVRVVGRLPDIPGAADPGFLVRVLRFAARARPLPRVEYERYFALTAQSWLCSTQLTLERVFGRVRRSLMRVSPGPREGALTAAKLSARMHFVNCHGGPFECSFEGEMDGLPLPRVDSLSTGDLAGKVPRGAVLTAECCYGAHLFDPNDRRAGTKGMLGIALEYLRQGAHAVFASTDTAYGGIYGTDSADILCGRFMERVLAGASLGRAALEARQDFLQFRPAHNPTHLKTVAQFVLLGDPSIHPVRRESLSPHDRGDSFTRAEARRLATRLRRDNLRRMGFAIVDSLPFMGLAKPPTGLLGHRFVRGIAHELGYSTREELQDGIRAYDLSVAAARGHFRRGDRTGTRRILVGMRKVFDSQDVIVAQLDGEHVLSTQRLASR